MNKLKANPRHSWACISTANQDFLEQSIKSSWKTLENTAAKSRRPADGESEGSFGSSDSSGEETPKSVSVKTSLPNESEYRTIKPLRPIQSKTLPRRASTGCASIAPHDQQTIINLVPPGQVIKVDISKSKEYASLDITATLTRRDNNSVMSSFKPTDSAKLYASPDDLKSIGYRESGIPSPDTNGNSTQRKTCRSQSLPRGTQEDIQLNRNIKPDYAQPEVKDKDKEKEIVNGSLTPNIPSGGIEKKGETDSNFDPQKSLQEAKERLKPVLKNNASSNNSSANDSTKIRIEVKQSPRLARKVEKTVTFQSEMTSPGGGAMSHSLSVDEFQKVKSNLKSSKSFPNDLGGEEHDGDGNSSGVNSEGAPDPRNLSSTDSTNNYVTCLPVNPDSDSSEDSSDKTWILNEENQSSQKRVSNTQTQLEINQNTTTVLISTSKSLNNSNVEDASYNNYTSRAGSYRNTPGTLTKNAVSLVKLPPPMELESEAEDKSPKATPIVKKTQKFGTTTTTVGSSPMYHTLQPQRSKSMLQDQGMASRQYQYATPPTQQPQGPARQAEKSIEESIKLIRMHVEALKVILLTQI